MVPLEAEGEENMQIELILAIVGGGIIGTIAGTVVGLVLFRAFTPLIESYLKKNER